MTLRRVGVLFAAGGVAAGLASVPLAHSAAGGSATVGMQTEAWYVTASSGACAPTELVDCSLLPDANFPEDTLHAGISGGNPTTMTLVEIDLFEASIPDSSDVTGGTLRLPVDPEPRDGSLQPETASLVVCPVADFMVDAKGSLKKPPKVDCDAASAPAKFTAKPAPTFTVDLTPFAKKLTDGEAGLAIMPAKQAVDDSQTWHVAFWGKDYGRGEEEVPLPEGEAKPKPITATLTHAPAGAEVALPPPVGPPPPPVGPPPEAEPLDNSAPVGPPPPPAPKAEAKELPTEAPEAVAAAPTLRTFGYPYPIAWLFPLLLLIGFAATGHSLTKRLERPGGLGWFTPGT